MTAPFRRIFIKSNSTDYLQLEAQPYFQPPIRYCGYQWLHFRMRQIWWALVKTGAFSEERSSIEPQHDLRFRRANKGHSWRPAFPYGGQFVVLNFTSSNTLNLRSFFHVQLSTGRVSCRCRPMQICLLILRQICEGISYCTKYLIKSWRIYVTRKMNWCCKKSLQRLCRGCISW